MELRAFDDERLRADDIRPYGDIAVNNNLSSDAVQNLQPAEIPPNAKKRRPKPARIFAQTRTTLSQFRRKRSAASLIFNVHNHLIQHEAHSLPVISRTSYHCRNALSSPSGKFFCFVLIGFTQLLVKLAFVDLFWKWWNSAVGEPFI